MHRYFYLAAVWCLLFLAPFGVVLAQQSSETSNSALAITVSKLESVTKVSARSAPATLVSLNDALVSAELAANITSIDRDIGDVVKQGELLASLDCRDFEASQRQAEANVAAIQGRIQAAKIRINSSQARIQANEAKVVSSQERLKANENSIKASKVRVEAGKARAAAAQSRASGSGVQIQTARARLEAANARCRQINNDFQRSRRLYDQRVISRQAFEQAQADFQVAQADCKASQSEVDNVRTNFSAGKADAQAAQAEVKASLADVHVAMANLDASRADINAEKANILAAKADVGAAQADIEALQGELQAAQAQAHISRLTVSRCDLSAPFDGQLTERLVQLGQRVGPGEAAFKILSLDTLEVSARLTPSELSALKQASQVSFTALGVELPVKFRVALAMVDGAARTQEARFEPEKAHELPVGSNGRLVWQNERPALPASWLVRRDEKLGVMVVKDEHARFIELMDAQEGQPAEVDLPSDTLLIDSGRFRAVDGQAVKITEE